jgi:valyl-tRNA synthetase
MSLSSAEMPKAYDPSSVEDVLYKQWEESGAFNPDTLPDRNQKGEPYCIMIPPPNRTGTLHLGHAMFLSLQDLMIRFQRLSGRKTLWVPGSDHAAIATQVKVEQLLIKEGIKDPRRELGREKFLERVVAFAEQSKETINMQVRKMGASCDWSREKYTFDAERNRAVNEMFVRMYEDGIIERGYRLVNWDPQFRTTLSDDEVQTKAIKAKLYTFTYDREFPIAISTTRPETKFGDTAVAVHPTDERYKALIGKTFTPTFCGKKLSIRIIGDEAVDPSFGTGALGVTPAHAMIDEEMAQRHQLPMEQVIGEDARLLPMVGEGFTGLTIEEARQKIETTLQAEGVLKSIEEIEQNLPVAERGGAPVEQLPMKQWFVRVNKPFVLRQNTLGKWKRGERTTLKELMRYAVDSSQVRIIPERFEKTYFHWIDNLRDWCISRQIWFGHQVPVWYRGEEMKAAAVKPSEEWQQDTDTLDTWFSSGSWTFSTLGWPDNAQVDADGNLVKSGELAMYHPTNVLETGYDIIFFWVARMILMSTYALGEVPFKDVYLHGLVRDEQGRKMSKSLGNILDPLDLIPKYGTDAVRLSLLLGSTPGQDSKLSEAKIEGFRNFTNKLWNIARFILSQIEANEAGTTNTLADQWINARLQETTASVTKKLQTYQFSSAGEELRDFTWGDLADWYLEIAKVEKGKAALLKEILRTILTLWHPFMPFVTESIWKQAGFEGMLIVGTWPNAVPQDEKSVKSFDELRYLVTAVRRLRADNGIEPSKQIQFCYQAQPKPRELVKSNEEWIKKLIGASKLENVEAVPSAWTGVLALPYVVGFDPLGAIDVAKEQEKTRKELTETQNYIKTMEAKLANQEFVSKAPAHVIEGMKTKLAEAQAKEKTLTERLRLLGV